MATKTVDGESEAGCRGRSYFGDGDSIGFLNGGIWAFFAKARLLTNRIGNLGRMDPCLASNPAQETQGDLLKTEGLASPERPLHGQEASQGGEENRQNGTDPAGRHGKSSRHMPGDQYI